MLSGNGTARRCDEHDDCTFDPGHVVGNVQHHELCIVQFIQRC